MLDFLLKYWPLILSAGGGLGWLIRLEAKVKETKNSLEGRIKENLERRIVELEKKETLIEKMAQDIVEIKTNIMWIKESKKL